MAGFRQFFKILEPGTRRPKPARAWFNPVRIVGMRVRVCVCVCVCVRACVRVCVCLCIHAQGY